MSRYAIRTMSMLVVLAVVVLATPSALADPTGAIEGTVIDEVTQKPIADVLVAAYWYCPGQGALLREDFTWTGPDGRYVLDNLPDQDGYYIKFSGGSVGYETEWYDDWHDVDNLVLYMLTKVEVAVGSVISGIDAALAGASAASAAASSSVGCVLG